MGLFKRKKCLNKEFLNYLKDEAVAIKPMEIKLEPLVLKLTISLKQEDLIKFKSKLEGKLNREVIILPKYVEVINPEVINSGVAIITCGDIGDNEG